jgi:antitoxin FitA
MAWSSSERRTDARAHLHAHHMHSMQITTMASMKAIQIRNVPDDVHRELRIRAAAAGQSLSDYALAELSEVAARPPIADVLRRAALRGGEPVRADEIVASIREGRDDRA